MTRIVHGSTIVLGIAVAAQVAFAYATKPIRPYWTIVPPPPTYRALMAQAFGDQEFLYRLFVMDLQNFGDTGGRNTPLRDYDMNTVVGWLEALDKLDSEANHHIMLASLYFSQTQHKSDLVPLVRYIMRHIDYDPPRKLPWASNALLLAELRLKDGELSKEIADQVAKYDFPGMQPIAYQLPALIYEKTGDFGRAAELMERAVDRVGGRASPDDVSFMEDFIVRMHAKAAHN